MHMHNPRIENRTEGNLRRRQNQHDEKSVEKEPSAIQIDSADAADGVFPGYYPGLLENVTFLEEELGQF